MIVVDAPLCPQNHVCPCVRVCPEGAISQKDLSAPDIDMVKCIECGVCVNTCPTGAIHESE